MWYGIAGILSILLLWQQHLIETKVLIGVCLVGGIPCFLIIGFCLLCEDADRRNRRVPSSRQQ